jgi:uncharacterized protein YjiS (DUF1127 family)
MIKRIIEIISHQKIINKTYKELYRLSDRELNDIGITRADIKDIAMDRYYNNIRKGAQNVG